ncbi:MAG: Fe(2+) transporter permease subunit FeoB [Pseudanabaenaceae cyanobacterium SKYGB_i_bin29]|nr:Fe(2+) transporter permease subunit FeoB [Pseudanabaenaceae cyanobacterium SKYG29]MDW8422615.1 Fe(2+) transporter permease subunit FeoB [Pseudanabaenaceae cyanobacterium SKYGB_i_bin29]
MTIKIGLVGNPNCGKTTLFNALTGANQRVGNWPGVTVEKKEGRYTWQNQQIIVVDLPGIYSLDGGEGAAGLDEQIAREFLLRSEADVIINIVDASNLERNLYLTTQILETGQLLIVALNMIDVAARREIDIDHEVLSQRLGCPVIPMSARNGRGIKQLKEAINSYNRKVSDAHVIYPPALETALQKLIHTRDLDKRWEALYLLQYGTDPELQAERQRVVDVLQEDIDLVIADSRYTWIHEQLEGVRHRRGVVDKTVSDRIDRVVVNRWLGIPIFLVVMYLMFFIAINVGGAFIDFFDIGVGTIAVDGVAYLLEKVSAPGWLIGLLAEGVGGGIQTTSTFIPQIGLLFIFLAILEDSGYMARAAFVMDRLMRFVGLPGKSFVPMLVGFGCNIPSIMSTRTLENRRDRLMTIIMNPFMSCGARLPVYALFCSAFFPRNGQNVVFILYILGILAAIFTGFVMKNTLFRGEAAPFVMELPPYHIPTASTVLLRAWDRLKSFITRAGVIIICLVVILGLMNSVGVDGSFGKKDSQDSILSSFSRTITPIFTPMGVRQENWPATVGIFTGVFAKEVMVGTMNALYTQLADQPQEEAEQPYSLWGGLQEAVMSIPHNLKEVANTFLDPIGLGILEGADNAEVAAEKQGVSATTFGEMAKRFGSSTAAIAFLLFVLMYFPCVSATAAVYRETNLGWTVFVAGWTTGLGYWTAVFYYQLMTWVDHPLSSLVWLIVLVGVMTVTILALRRVGLKRKEEIHHA